LSIYQSEISSREKKVRNFTSVWDDEEENEKCEAIYWFKSTFSCQFPLISNAFQNIIIFHNSCNFYLWKNSYLLIFNHLATREWLEFQKVFKKNYQLFLRCGN
jgi:hypothetical protein